MSERYHREMSATEQIREQKSRCTHAANAMLDPRIGRMADAPPLDGISAVGSRKGALVWMHSIQSILLQVRPGCRPHRGDGALLPKYVPR